MARENPFIRPVHPAPPDRYARIFPERTEGRPTDGYLETLKALAWSMQRDGTAIPEEIQERDPPFAGYTYFGQFIDHDLTEDHTAMRNAGKREPWETFNHRGPWLDLSGIYDRAYDCGRWKQLYGADGISFRLGRPTLSNGEQFDVPLDDRGYPLVGDPRNNENVIVRQIHAMFLKLHNLAIQELRVEKPSLSDQERFEAARERVCWQYQYLVRQDFLKRVCSETVFRDLITQNGVPIIDWKRDGFSIPVEVSQAILRFGHSMVRPDYRLSISSGRLGLDLLLCARQARALREDEAVNWASFLVVGEKAMRIDTGVASPLYQLHDKDIHPFVSSPVPHPPHPLPVRTLVRGAQSRLPTGQRIATKMHVPILVPPLETARGYDPCANLRKYGLVDDTPLWYYILLEAEIQERGACLGALGSQLLAETVNAALTEDPESYVRRFGPDSIPNLWKKTNEPVLSLYQLAQLVNLSP